MTTLVFISSINLFNFSRYVLWRRRMLLHIHTHARTQKERERESGRHAYNAELIFFLIRISEYLDNFRIKVGVNATFTSQISINEK